MSKITKIIMIDIITKLATVRYRIDPVSVPAEKEISSNTLANQTDNPSSMPGGRTMAQYTSGDCRKIGFLGNSNRRD
jgi:hypothetical protein